MSGIRCPWPRAYKSSVTGSVTGTQPRHRCPWQAPKPQLHSLPSQVTSEASGVFVPLSSSWLLIQSKRPALCVCRSP